MVELMAVGLLLVLGAVVVGTVAIAALLFKLLIRIILLPLLLLKWLIGGLVFFIVGPVIALVGLVVMLAVGAALALPLLPFALVGLFVYLLVRASRRPAIARA